MFSKDKDDYQYEVKSDRFLRSLFQEVSKNVRANPERNLTSSNIGRQVPGRLRPKTKPEMRKEKRGGPEVSTDFASCI
ncbi:predicted protein [Sclerotinia sclerotiorum 1980 UF-70]|uniref:Uncharacterized protein n=1 Tax=Sclerotinia sclerotiorum (strain ATCC 18683 / 1980 / Ss-1) TaxID=665079 RepID=A7ELX4_SCLS1|nr:predicted protein [Sclerotinia sclerotiorum 1980 UF-70]EDO03840.1 predicted protein [Sclerotinia sclerotiorum 1980 UF-70]